jgi:hypothetical protein
MNRWRGHFQPFRSSMSDTHCWGSRLERRAFGWKRVYPSKPWGACWQEESTIQEDIYWQSLSSVIVYIRCNPKLDSLGSEGEVCRFSNKAETPESRAWNHFSSTGAGAAWARIPAKRTEETRLENMARDVESRSRGRVVDDTR